MAADNTEINELKARLRVMEDKEAIRDVLAKYAFNVDLRRYDNFVKLFTPDGIFTTDVDGKNVTQKGRAAIKKFVANLPAVKTEHLQLMCVIEVEKDTALSTGYQIMPMYNKENSRFFVFRCSFRTFRFQRVKGKWLIKEAISCSITNEACGDLVPEIW